MEYTMGNKDLQLLYNEYTKEELILLDKIVEAIINENWEEYNKLMEELNNGCNE